MPNMQVESEHNYTIQMIRKHKPYYVRCWVPGCTNSNKNSNGLAFHSFPSDPILRKTWVYKCRIGIGKKIKGHIKVCSEHFLPSDYKQISTATKKFLYTNAVPCCKLPPEIVVFERRSSDYTFREEQNLGNLEDPLSLSEHSLPEHLEAPPSTSGQCVTCSSKVVDVANKGIQVNTINDLKLKPISITENIPKTSTDLASFAMLDNIVDAVKGVLYKHNSNVDTIHIKVNRTVHNKQNIILNISM